jgi:MFS transporter, PAT family, beta-lactamase induction signal transducer AmpG
VYLSERRGLRLFTLCILYVAQGLPYGFVTVTLAAYLKENHLGKAELATLLAMTTLPWSFKWCWGPVVDYFQIPSLGRRRPWILFSQLMMFLSMGCVLFVPDLVADIRSLIVIVCIHNVFGAMQDVSVDALAVDLLTEHERGTANGFMYGSSYFGTMVGGAGLGLIVIHLGLRTAVSVQLTILASIFIVPLLFRERPGDRFIFPNWNVVKDEGGASFLSLFAEFAYAFRFPLTWLCALLALVVKIGMGVSLTTSVSVFIEHYGYTMEQYSLVMGGAAVICGLSGSVLGGVLADRIGASDLAFGAATMLGIVWCGFGLLEAHWAQDHWISGFLCLQEFFMSALTVSLFALFMGVAVPGVAATQFTAYMALLNLSTTFGVKMAGYIPETGEPGQIFIGMGLFQVVPIAILLVIGRIYAKRAAEKQGKKPQ